MHSEVQRMQPQPIFDSYAAALMLCSCKAPDLPCSAREGVQAWLSQVEALKQGKITKPVVAWVSGTCAKLFKSEVQFGHAGAKSGGDMESAQVTFHVNAVTVVAC